MSLIELDQLDVEAAPSGDDLLGFSWLSVAGVCVPF